MNVLDFYYDEDDNAIYIESNDNEMIIRLTNDKIIYSIVNDKISDSNEIIFKNSKNLLFEHLKELSTKKE